MIDSSSAAIELLRREEASERLINYINYTNKHYKVGYFSQTVCEALDKFMEDVIQARRPVLVLQAPAQHGKSEIVSRRFPAFLFGRFPDIRIGAASYSDDLAKSMAQDVRRTLASPEHQRVFNVGTEKRRYDINRMGEFTAPQGNGSYVGVGVGAGLTGRPVDIGLIDDPVKNAQEALSVTTKESHWNWYQTVFKTRLSERSGQVIIATSWAEDDLAGRIVDLYRNDPRLRVMRFPAINLPDEVGYNFSLPEGALVPELHSIEQLREIKAETSDYWWATMYQQVPRAQGGNVFKEQGIKLYFQKDLPIKYDKVVASWDCTFKDTDGTDFVVGQIWGRAGAHSYLLDQIRDRMSFTKTIESIVALHEKWPIAREILIEDKANGPAVIDTLKRAIPGIIPIEPDGSKLARAHAVTSYWEAGNIFLPNPIIAPWSREFLSELTAFPVAAHDDQVDAMTQAIRRLYPAYEKIKINPTIFETFRRKL